MFWIAFSALISLPGIANPARADAWERRPPANLNACPSLDSSLIVPVPVAHRPEAIARLKNVALVKLTPPQLEALLGHRAGIAWSGENQLKKETARLKEQRRQELENHQGSWSLYDQQRLDGLTKMLADPTTLNLFWSALLQRTKEQARSPHLYVAEVS